MMTHTFYTPKKMLAWLTKLLLSVFASIFGILLFLSVLQLAEIRSVESSHSMAYELGLLLGRFLKLLTTFFNAEKVLGLGSLMALIASWDRNRSVRWALLHAFFGWFYVGYFVRTRKASDAKNQLIKP